MNLGISHSSEAGLVCLALAAALLGGARARRLAASGLLVLGLALAAWRSGSPEVVGALRPDLPGRGFLVGNAGLLLLGTGLAGRALMGARSDRVQPWSRLLGAAGIFALSPVLVFFLREAGPWRAAAAALGIWLLGAAVAAAWRAMASSPAGRSAARRVAPPPLPPMPWSGENRRTSLALLAGVTAALAGPHVVVIGTGVMLATWAAWFRSHAQGTRPVPIAPVLTLVLLPTCWLLATVAGPIGLGLPTLPQVPLSPAAELLLTPALLAAGWASAGLWPLQRQLPGALSAAAGALLLARVAHPLVPDGLEYWRPLAVPLLVLGLWNAAAWDRWPLLLAGASILAVAGDTPVPVAGCAALLAAALGLELASVTGTRRRLPLAGRAAIWLLVTWAGMRVLEAVLRGEVVYTTIGVIVLALVLATRRSRDDEPVRAAR